MATSRGRRTAHQVMPGVVTLHRDPTVQTWTWDSGPLGPDGYAYVPLTTWEEGTSQWIGIYEVPFVITGVPGLVQYVDARVLVAQGSGGVAHMTCWLGDVGLTGWLPGETYEQWIIGNADVVPPNVVHINGVQTVIVVGTGSPFRVYSAQLKIFTLR